MGYPTWDFMPTPHNTHSYSEICLSNIGYPTWDFTLINTALTALCNVGNQHGKTNDFIPPLSTFIPQPQPPPPTTLPKPMIHIAHTYLSKDGVTSMETNIDFIIRICQILHQYHVQYKVL